MSLDRARRYAEHFRGAVGIQVEEQPQRDYLPLPGRQPDQRRHDPRIDGAVGGPADHERFRDHAGVWHRYLPAVAPPPGDMCVQRDTDHPRNWCRMSADVAPRCTRPGEGLVNKILRRIQVTDAHQYGAQAIILRPAVELREVQSLGSHIYSTYNRPPGTTRLVGRPPLRRYCSFLVHFPTLDAQ